MPGPPEHKEDTPPRRHFLKRLRSMRVRAKNPPMTICSKRPAQPREPPATPHISRIVSNSRCLGRLVELLIKYERSGAAPGNGWHLLAEQGSTSFTWLTETPSIRSSSMSRKSFNPRGKRGRGHKTRPPDGIRSLPVQIVKQGYGINASIFLHDSPRLSQRQNQ